MADPCSSSCGGDLSPVLLWCLVLTGSTAAQSAHRHRHGSGRRGRPKAQGHRGANRSSDRSIFRRGGQRPKIALCCEPALSSCFSVMHFYPKYLLIYRKRRRAVADKDPEMHRVVCGVVATLDADSDLCCALSRLGRESCAVLTMLRRTTFVDTQACFSPLFLRTSVLNPA